MPRSVPFVAPLIDASQVTPGAPVASDEWRSGALLNNYLSGQWTMLVAAHRPHRSALSSGAAVYRYNVWPRAQSLHRIWVLSLSCDGDSEIQIEDSTESVSRTFHIRGGEGQPQAFYLRVTIASPTAGSTTHNLIITENTGNTLTVHSIACFGCPRSELTVAENGRDEGTLSQSKFIYAGTNISVVGLANAIDTTRSIARRTSFFHAGGDNTSPYFENSTNTYQSIFYVPISLLARKRYNSETSGTLGWRVYAEATGSTGNVRLQTTSGASNTINITAGAGPGWYPASPNTFSVNAEDLSEGAGLPSSTVDAATIQGRRGASGTIWVYAIAIGEP